jgi:hypothetical protein
MQPNSCAIQKVKNDMVSSGQKGNPPSIGSSDPDQPPTAKQNRLPLELTDIMARALRFGGLSGMLMLLCFVYIIKRFLLPLFIVMSYKV